MAKVKISELPSLSSATLDTTFVVGISGSTTYKISINQLTSSLDTTFATDLVTAALSSSLNSKLSTSSFNTFTQSYYSTSASFDSRVDSLEFKDTTLATTSSLEIVSASAWGAFQSASSYSSSLQTAISASDAEYTSFSASLQTSISSSNYNITINSASVSSLSSSLSLLSSSFNLTIQSGEWTPVIQYKDDTSSNMDLFKQTETSTGYFAKVGNVVNFSLNMYFRTNYYNPNAVYGHWAGLCYINLPVSTSFNSNTQLIGYIEPSGNFDIAYEITSISGSSNMQVNIWNLSENLNHYRLKMNCQYIII